MFFSGAIFPERKVAQVVPLSVRIARIPARNAIPTMQEARRSCRRIKEVLEAPYKEALEDTDAFIRAPPSAWMKIRTMTDDEGNALQEQIRKALAALPGVELR